CSARSWSASWPSSTATGGAARMPTRRSTASTTSPPGHCRCRSISMRIGLKMQAPVVMLSPTRSCRRRPRPRAPRAPICSPTTGLAPPAWRWRSRPRDSGWLWNFLARELHAPFTPVPLRAIGQMDDLQSFNVLIIPDGSGGRMRRELGDGGVDKLKAWVRSGGVLVGYGGAGDLAANKDLGLSSVVSVASDSGAKADTTAPGDEPALISSTAPPKNRPEWIPGAIFRATIDTTQWLTAGYERNRLPVFIDGDTFWKPSKGGANAATFTDPVDSLV